MIIIDWWLVVEDENCSPLVMEIWRKEDGLAFAIRLLFDWWLINCLTKLTPWVTCRTHCQIDNWLLHTNACFERSSSYGFQSVLRYLLTQCWEFFWIGLSIRSLLTCGLCGTSLAPPCSIHRLGKHFWSFWPWQFPLSSLICFAFLCADKSTS